MTMCFDTWQKGFGRNCEWQNAGQTQPLLWKDGRCEKLELTGLPLGLYDDAKYDEASYTLTTGDILVFYSDGFSESAATYVQFFGCERLVAAIAANHELSGERSRGSFAGRSGTVHARRAAVG